MSTKLTVLIMIAVLGITGISLCIAVLLPSKWRWPWQWYRYNLRWYRAANRCRFYRSANLVTSRLYVVMGFSWWRGRIKFRMVSAGRPKYFYAKAGEYIECNAHDFSETGQLKIKF